MATNCTMHTPCPENYLDWHEWAREKNETHRQCRCDECGLYEIWVARKQDKSHSTETSEVDK